MRALDWIKANSGALGFAVGLIGILIGFYSHYVPRDYREIAYSSSAVKIFDFDPKRIGDSIKLLDKDGVAVDADVYHMTVNIWNSGTLPV